MAGIKAKIKEESIKSLKARDAARTQTLRTLLSVIQKKEIDEHNENLDDAVVTKVLQTTMKQLQETFDQAKSLNRTEIMSGIEAEMKIVKEFLPAQLSGVEVEAKVKAIVEKLKSSGTLPQGGAAMGAIMKAVMSEIGSQSDGKTIQAAVKKALV